MASLSQKKDLVLRHERLIANSIGEAVFEKPKVSFWMILIPILFLYFIYRMQRFKLGRMKFEEEFLTPRRQSMDAVLNALETNSAPDIGEIVRSARLPDPLQPLFASWIGAIAGHYADLLAADGENYESLARVAYGNRDGFIQTLNRLNETECAFLHAIKPYLDSAGETDDIVARIASRSTQLQRDMTDRIFPAPI